MTWVAALFIVVGFMALVHLLGIPARAAAVVGRSRAAVADMRSAELSEIDKERAMQAHARQLFWLFLIITVSAAVALVVPVGIVALGDLAGLVEFDAVVDATLSWELLLGATLIGGAGFAILRSRRR